MPNSRETSNLKFGNRSSRGLEATKKGAAPLYPRPKCLQICSLQLYFGPSALEKRVNLAHLLTGTDEPFPSPDDSFPGPNQSLLRPDDPFPGPAEPFLGADERFPSPGE